MARGQKCPKCARLTFHSAGQVRECSDPECAVVGWLDSGPDDSSSRGSNCGYCGKGTMKLVTALDGGCLVHWCFNCSAVYISN